MKPLLFNQQETKEPGAHISALSLLKVSGFRAKMAAMVRRGSSMWAGQADIQ